MQINLPNGLENSLIWWPEKGMGFHPAPAIQYDGDYFESYVQRDQTQMGVQLTDARIGLVTKYTQLEHVVDIGIGGGRFVHDSGCRGYDVNESAVAWLRNHGWFCSPYASPVFAVTCWDSLEHIDKPWKLLKQVERFLFVSLPTFRDHADVLSSKHYKPGEHLWYWTSKGLIDWCAEHGFIVREVNTMESDLGRDGITSFVFEREQS